MHLERKESQPETALSDGLPQGGTPDEKCALCTEARRLQVNLYERLLDSLPTPVFIKDEEGRYCGCNRLFARQIMGIPKEAILGRTLFQLVPMIPEEMARTYHERDAELFRTGGQQSYETDVRFADGSIHRMQLVKAVLELDPLTGEAGQSRWMIGAMIDITARFRLEQEMESTKRRYSDILNSIQEGIGVVDREERIQYCNPGMVRILGASVESELIGRSILDFVPEEEHGKVIEQSMARQRGESSRYELTMINMQGQRRTVLISVAPRIDENGHFIGTFGNVLDITDHKRLEESMRLLSSAIESADDAVEVFDTDGVVSFANEAHAELTGIPVSRSLGARSSLLIHDSRSSLDRAGLQGALVGGEGWSATYRRERADGSVVHEFGRVAPISDKSGRVTHFVAIRRDITELVQLHQRMSQAQKLEAVSVLAAGIAHDFNNLMAIVHACTETVEEMVVSIPAAREPLRAIRDAVERAADMTRQLLMFSRQDESAPAQVTDVVLLLNNLRNMISRLGRHRHELHMRLPEQPVLVKINTGQFERIILNLVTNAQLAMPQGGNVTLSLTTQEFDGSPACTVCGRSLLGACAVLSCVDTGVGMDESTMARIFEPFFTTRAIGEGTGLGLSAVRGILEAAGGHIMVTSSPGKGSRFDVVLPLHERSASDPRTEAAVKLDG